MRVFHVTLRRPPFLTFLTYSPTRTFLEPRRRYRRTRTRRVLFGTVNFSLRPLRWTSRSESRLRIVSFSTDGAGRLRDGAPFLPGPPGPLPLDEPAGGDDGRSLISEFCAVQLSPGSGLIGQPGSDMTRIRPHMPAVVKGRRIEP